LSDIQDGFNELVLDVQGAEMEVLKSGDITKFESIRCEMAEKPRHEGESPGKEIIKYITSKGFKITKEWKASRKYRMRNGRIGEAQLVKDIIFTKT